ncbi:MAG TPA: MarR family transcriptional regulator [Pseudonocardiaceae bacterium]|jgi:DNA-binding MarR family transcriptional regulator|nr:MarR family transcriptional regulator [Pseudonocardiaceae bacterium]
MSTTGRPEPGPELDLRAVLPRFMQLGNLLNRSKLMEHAMAQAGNGLDRPSMSVLISLQLTNQPMRIGEIAARMQVAGPHVTRHVHELEQRGLVRRLADAQDRRARPIELTAEGAAIAGRYLRIMLGHLGSATDNWSDEDRQTFYRLLGRFADDLAASLAALDEE